MNIGFVGLGRMGANMTERLLLGGHTVVGYDRSSEAVQQVVAKGAQGAESLPDLVSRLEDRRAVWLMVPAGDPVNQTLEALVPLLKPGDLVIDGGNSFWRDSVQRARRLAGLGMHFVDCGTSGGVWGLKNGYCLMYGGDREACDFLKPVFETLAPPGGHLYCGPSGAGHFVKMVHNGIEYGMMQAYAEGFELMQAADFPLDLHAISHLWQQGSVVRSWLLELTERALGENPDLSGLEGRVADSGEGRWTVETAVALGVPVPVLAQALFRRFESRQDNAFGNRLLAALRHQFGGHPVETSRHEKTR